ncbi:MAG: hypothetical protein IJF83_09075 [Methanobrevibacter sp.]|nr:hypothetical protein [Methanobrevibacter sp.]
MFDKNPTILVLNGQSLEDYVKFQFNNFGNNDDFDWENEEYYHCIEVIDFNYKLAPGGPKPINESFFEVGKFIKENYDLLLENIEESNYKGIITKAGWIGIAIYIVILTILNYFKNMLDR